ncbi:MAG: DUF2621 family protein [Gammaproteobacteria bacterium]
MNFVTAVVHAVADLEGAAAFFMEALDFREQSRGLNAIVVENGALAIRLVAAGENRAGELELEMTTADLDGAAAQWLQRQEVSQISAPAWVNPERMEMRLRAPHGVVLRLAREFDEDELGVLRDLPTSLDWMEEAESCVKRILRFVPVGFRDNARRRVTERAEHLAIKAGEVTVDKTTALRGLVLATPDFQIEGLRQSLRAEGVDPEPLFAELSRP